MSDDPNDILRQAEDAARIHEADVARRPSDRPTLHRQLDAIPDSRLVEVAWLLSVLELDSLQIPSEDRNPSMDQLAEHLNRRPAERWFGFLHMLIHAAPRSWFDGERRVWLVRAAVAKAAVEAFNVPIGRPEETA